MFCYIPPSTNMAVGIYLVPIRAPMTSLFYINIRQMHLQYMLTPLSSHCYTPTCFGPQGPPSGSIDTRHKMY